MRMSYVPKPPVQASKRITRDQHNTIYKRLHAARSRADSSMRLHISKMFKTLQEHMEGKPVSANSLLINSLHVTQPVITNTTPVYIAPPNSDPLGSVAQWLESYASVLNAWTDEAREKSLEIRREHAGPAGSSHTKDPTKQKFIGQLVGKAEHEQAASVEHEVAKAVDGKVVSKEEGKYAPRDVQAGSNDIEVKSLLKGKKQNLSVHEDSLLKKVERQQATGNKFHTVAVDERATYEGGIHAENYSGNRIYYKRGSGRYSLSQMHPVKDAEELKKLIAAKDEELPDKAKGALPSGDRLEQLKELAVKAHTRRFTKDKARKQRLKEEGSEE